MIADAGVNLLAVSNRVTEILSNAPASGAVTLSICPTGEAKSGRDDTNMPPGPTGAGASSSSAVRTGGIEGRRRIGFGAGDGESRAKPGQHTEHCEGKAGAYTPGISATCLALYQAHCA